MPRRVLLFALLAFVGLLKAGSVVWVGGRLGLPSWLVTLSAALWALGPALAGWAWQRRGPAAPATARPHDGTTALLRAP
ncbi:MAG TPA: hypothetical protein VFH78_00410 [Candidatus Thermoplasmatota archaeon]|nr:hypothetical protein [Candidatus Thermoplasmatota archaeon]